MIFTNQIETLPGVSSRLLDSYRFEVPHRVILDLFRLTNIYVHPSTSESYSLVSDRCEWQPAVPERRRPRDADHLRERRSLPQVLLLTVDHRFPCGRGRVLRRCGPRRPRLHQDRGDRPATNPASPDPQSADRLPRLLNRCCTCLRLELGQSAALLFGHTGAPCGHGSIRRRRSHLSGRPRPRGPRPRRRRQTEGRPCRQVLVVSVGEIERVLHTWLIEAFHAAVGLALLAKDAVEVLVSVAASARGIEILGSVAISGLSLIGNCSWWIGPEKSSGKSVRFRRLSNSVRPSRTGPGRRRSFASSRRANRSSSVWIPLLSPLAASSFIASIRRLTSWSSRLISTGSVGALGTLYSSARC